MLRIYIDGSDEPIQTTYTAVVANAVNMTPARLYFGAIRRGQKVTRKVHAVLDDEVAIQSLHAETSLKTRLSFRSPDTALSGELYHAGTTTDTERNNADKTTLEVMFGATFSPDNTTEKGLHKGELTVVFKDRTLLTIPYMAVVLD